MTAGPVYPYRDRSKDRVAIAIWRYLADLPRPEYNLELMKRLRAERDAEAAEIEAYYRSP